VLDLLIGGAENDENQSFGLTQYHSTIHEQATLAAFGFFNQALIAFP